MKKALKIIGTVVLVLLIFLFAAPFLFQGTIEKEVKKAINNNINATVEWQDLSLSLFSSFPDARLKLEGVSVINHAPFEDDTLVYSKMIALDMGIMQLFGGGDEPLSVNELIVDDALVNIKVNKQGVANYDIAKASDEPEQVDTASASGISLDVQHYEINDSRINYLDESSQMFLRLSQFNHEGTGDFSAATSVLHTQTQTLVSFAMDSTNYLDHNSLNLQADIKMDLANMKFSFKENKALINQLPLTFDGYVQVNDDNQQLDISFKTPTSDFKNFLGLIPKAYAESLDGVTTTGEFSVNGRLYGVVDDQHIPKMKITMKSADASFKYPDLPKAVENITIDAVLVNETGLMKDLNLDLNQLTFKIGQDVFAARGAVKNLTGDMVVDLTANGTLNLGNIEKAYPIDTDLDLNGILQADLSTAFAMSDIENEHYQNIKSRGAAKLTDFVYASEDFPNPIKISLANLSFDPGNVKLKAFDMTTGKTDIHLNGQLKNLMGFLFKGQAIKGTFDLSSALFAIDDFMMPVADAPEGKAESKPVEGKTTTQEESAIKVPDFLDVTLNFNADKALYDGMALTDVKGALVIRDETAHLKAISAHVFGGTIGLDGSVSTKTETPEFKVDLSLKKIDIVQSIQEMDLLKNLAPIARALVGDLSTSISLNGDLTNGLTPIYSTIAGKGFATILDAKVQENKMPLISQLNSKLNFLDFDKLNLKEVTTHFTLEDGGIKIKPFNLKIYDNITAKISGKHTFDNKIDYELNLDLPAKYLGTDVSGVLSKLSGSELENTTVHLPVEFHGSLTSPKIKVDLESATKELADRVVAEQKDNLKAKAKDKLQDLFGGKTDKASGDKTKDTTEKSGEDKLKNAANDLLNGLFGGKNKKKEGAKK